MGSLRCLRHRGQPEAWSSDPGSAGLPPSGRYLLHAYTLGSPPRCLVLQVDRGPSPGPAQSGRLAQQDCDPALGLDATGAGMGVPGHTWTLPGTTTLAATLPAQATLGEMLGPGLQASAEEWPRGTVWESSSRLPELGGLAGLLAAGIREAVTGSGGCRGWRAAIGLRPHRVFHQAVLSTLGRSWAGLVSLCGGFGGSDVGGK